MAELQGQMIIYHSPGPNIQERRMPHHKGAVAVFQNSDNTRLYVECSYGGSKYTEEWEIPVASSVPKLLGSR